jgi:hypothetical protein
VAAWLAWQLAWMPSRATWGHGLWLAAVILLGVSAFLGAIVHGFDFHDSTRTLLWKPLHLCLSAIAGVLLVCAVSDWRGASAGLAAVPIAAAMSLVLFAATQLRRASVAIFLVLGVVGTVFPVAVYSWLALHHEAGALPIAAGLIATIAAVVVQRSRLTLRVIVLFDHNGLFHLVQLGGIALIALGVRQRLLAH